MTVRPTPPSEPDTVDGLHEAIGECRARLQISEARLTEVRAQIEAPGTGTGAGVAPPKRLIQEERSLLREIEEQTLRLPIYHARLADALAKREAPISEQVTTEIRNGLDVITRELTTAVMSNATRAEIQADIIQIEAEAGRPAPRRRFMRLFLESFRDNLAKAAGAAAATGVLASIGGIVAKLLGLL